MSDQGSKPGFFRRAFRLLRAPSTVFSMGGLVIGGFVGGILFWGGFHWALELTNTEEFCISCHEMQRNFDEYKETVHYNNHSGVRATCPDCHVPKDWQHKIKAKVLASKDVYHTLVGTIDTPEKYQEHRLAMASQSWAKMKKSDSRECRNCHNFDYMDFTIQENRAAANHQQALDEGLTCIDCHQGVAHNLPENYLETYRALVEDLAAAGEIPPPKPRDVAQAQADSQSDIRSYLSKAPAE